MSSRWPAGNFSLHNALHSPPPLPRKCALPPPCCPSHLFLHLDPHPHPVPAPTPPSIFSRRTSSSHPPSPSGSQVPDSLPQLPASHHPPTKPLSSWLALFLGFQAGKPNRRRRVPSLQDLPYTLSKLPPDPVTFLRSQMSTGSPNT